MPACLLSDLKVGLSTSSAPGIYRSITSAAEAHGASVKLGAKGMVHSFIGTPVLPAQMVKLQYPVRKGRIVSYPRVKKLWTDALTNDFDTDFEDRAVTMSAPLSRDLVRLQHARAPSRLCYRQGLRRSPHTAASFAVGQCAR